MIILKSKLEINGNSLIFDKGSFSNLPNLHLKSSGNLDLAIADIVFAFSNDYNCVLFG